MGIPWPQRQWVAKGMGFSLSVMALVPQLDSLVHRVSCGLAFHRAIIVPACYGIFVGVANAPGVCVMAAEWARQRLI